MTVTTGYGTWNNRVESGSVSVEDSVAAALGEHSSDYDLAGIAGAWRSAINAALPQGVSLNGDVFYGPFYRQDCHFEGYPTDAVGQLDIKAIVDGIDFWAIVERHHLCVQS